MFSIRYTFLTFIFFIQLFFFNNWMNGNWIIIITSLIPIFTSIKMIFKKNFKKNIKNSIFLSISVISGIFILLYGVHNNENEKAGLGLWMYLFALCIMIWEMLSSWSEVDTSLNSKLNLFINLVVPIFFWYLFTFFMASFDSRIKYSKYTITLPGKNRNRLFKFNPNVVGRFSTNFFKGCLIWIFYGMFFRIYHCNHG